MSRRAISFVALVLVLVIGGYAATSAWTALHVATGYAARLTCSLTRNSGLSPAVVRSDLLEHVLDPVASSLTITASDCCASASLHGAGWMRAVYRRGLGCTLLAGRSESDVPSLETRPEPHSLPADRSWPEGDAPIGPASAAIEAAIDEAFREIDPTRVRQTKAIVVAHRGRLVAERYAPGFSAATPMISWSMAKSVTAALVGIAIGEGRLSLDAPAPVPEWSGEGDPRGAITLDQLLRMSSGLEFDETYGAINDVSTMLFARPDTAHDAATKPLAGAPDSVWSYSSGTTNIVARLLATSAGGTVPAFLEYARSRLFDPARLSSAFFEFDAAGTPIGSSFVFMTARDWARFGELSRNDGVAGTTRVLPEGWMRYSTKPTAKAPLGEYGAHWWLNAGKSGDDAERLWKSLPADAYAARGYAGQWTLVIPSQELVVVRLGMSFPDDGDDGTETLARTLIDALEEDPGQVER